MLLFHSRRLMMLVEAIVWATLRSPAEGATRAARQLFGGKRPHGCSATICEDAGLTFALEPHPHRYMTGAASMLRLIEHVQSPALGMNLDPSHRFPLGELPHAVVYQLRDRIVHCHFSDNDGLTNVHWRPGKGKIDWEALMRALHEVGYDGVISIELEECPASHAGALRCTAVTVRQPLRARPLIRRISRLSNISVQSVTGCRSRSREGLRSDIQR